MRIGKHHDGRERYAIQLVVDPEKAPLVKKVFQLRAEGLSFEEIHQATKLFTTRGGYRRSLDNPIFLGRLVRKNGLVVEDFCEPLIDQETFDAVQAINQMWREKKLHPRRVLSSFLLSGLLSCGMCGRGVTGRSYHPTKQRKRYYYYRCVGNGAIQTCDNPMVQAGRLEKFVFQAIKDTLFNRDALLTLYELARDKSRSRTDEEEQLTARIKGEMADVKRRIGRLTSAILDLGHSKALLAELQDQEEQLDALASDLAIARSKVQRDELPDLSPEEITGLSESFRQALDTADHRQKQLLLRRFVKQVRFVGVEGAKLASVEVVLYPPPEISNVEQVVRY